MPVRESNERPSPIRACNSSRSSIREADMKSIGRMIHDKMRPEGRAFMAKKVNPLNNKVYRAVTTMLTVTDVKAAAAFYKKAFGFATQVMMPGPDGKPMHAELRLRDAVVMLGPESPERGARSAKTIGSSPASLYVMVENAD